jgi:hypothetical protein
MRIAKMNQWMREARYQIIDQGLFPCQEKIIEESTPIIAELDQLVLEKINESALISMAAWSANFHELESR